jgi:hypothetical protein
MNWDQVRDRMRDSGLPVTEEIYMENYGKILAAQRPEFDGRNFRCAYGVVNCGGLRIEAFLFPSEGHLNEFIEVIGSDPWWIPYANVIFHFPQSDPELVEKILQAIAQRK